MVNVKKLSKMNAEKLQAEFDKVKAQEPKLHDVVGVINRRMQVVKDNIIMGEKPEFDMAKLEKDLADVKAEIFEIEKFERLLPDMLKAIADKVNRERNQKIFENFKEGLKNAAADIAAGKEPKPEDIGKIKNGAKNIESRRLLHKLGL